MIRFKDLEAITAGKFISFSDDQTIDYLLVDSRKLIISIKSVFFAIKGIHHDGHHYLSEIYQQGIRQFVVENPDLIPSQIKKNSNIILVNHSLEALQAIATHHRSQFNLPVIGVTGSNGKTIVKEWLFDLLNPTLRVVKSPKSYNSQLGVPLSVWQINASHQLGIFEAGISQAGEMDNLNKVIQPSIGIFTNLGSAHNQGFRDRKHKASEKASLFRGCKIIFYRRDYPEVDEVLRAMYKSQIRLFSWSTSQLADLQVLNLEKGALQTRVGLRYQEHHLDFVLPFTDDASIENCMLCLSYLLYENFAPPRIQNRLDQLEKLSMRLELKQGIKDCYIIDDSYSNDLASLQIALNFLDQQNQRERKTLIISDILQSGQEKDVLYQQVQKLLQDKDVDRVIGIGPDLAAYQDLFPQGSVFFNTTEDLLLNYPNIKFDREVILIKGARKFQFEKIVQKLQQKTHGTVLEINLDHLTQNLNFYRKQLAPTTRIMVMVKAFAYGSGSFEVANLLQFHKVDYLAVAYADEGISLRAHGISTPVMVMNPSPESLGKMMEFQLEPEIYNIKLLKSLINHQRPYEDVINIHLKLDTGMHRLGFEAKDLDELIKMLKSNPQINVKSIFTHLAGADDEIFNEFSHQQVSRFKSMSSLIKENLNIDPLLHVLNSAGIIRFPHFQFDMVRLGIGLYGVEVNDLKQNQLVAISTLKTRISQIKQIHPSETVGYSRKGKVDQISRIATIGLGYADGFSRAFSNGKGKVMVNGKLVPVIGNVCMDMTMINVTGIQADEGDEVIIFGPELPLQHLAQAIDTIPYEILTNVSERVKRVFFTE
ncbi:MAG: bifunctional UDP-N-acetylmuramoyl-tripeptide:D-alanyl-D-alanine ligase/alanine racemase [Candidatus Cyclobacteriaceae bacterium M3_2C_046]